MNDDQIEALLRRYRPIVRRLDIPRLPDSPATRVARTWPWAIAAAALLAIAIGRHAAAWTSAPPASDARQIAAIADQLGGGTEGRAVAEWIVAQERAP